MQAGVLRPWANESFRLAARFLLPCLFLFSGATARFDRCGVGADEAQPGGELTAEQKQREKLLQRMTQRAAGIEVQVITDQGHVAARLVAEPLLRYNDQPRRLRDATMWCWCDDQGRPVALF